MGEYMHKKSTLENLSCVAELVAIFDFLGKQTLDVFEGHDQQCSASCESTFMQKACFTIEYP